MLPLPKCFSLIALLLIAIESVRAGICTGCVELDDLTFDKLVKKFGTVLVKFDIAYPYGDKHETYAKFALQATPQIDDFLVSVVGIKDYGEKDNSKLGQRFNVGEKYPVIKLFKNGNPNEWVDYPTDLEITIENLRQFVRQHSSVYMVLKGCLQQFDDVAGKLVAAIAKSGAESPDINVILNEAENLNELLDDDKKKEIAKIYLLIMKRIQEKGLEFVSSERTRLKHLLTGKISDNKKSEIQQKLNILTAFNQNADIKVNVEEHNEL